MKFREAKKSKSVFLEMLSKDSNLEEYYKSLPKWFKQEINKKSGMIKTPEDLYQMVDNLIQTVVDE